MREKQDLETHTLEEIVMEYILHYELTQYINFNVLKLI